MVLFREQIPWINHRGEEEVEMESRTKDPCRLCSGCWAIRQVSCSIRFLYCMSGHNVECDIIHLSAVCLACSWVNDVILNKAKKTTLSFCWSKQLANLLCLGWQTKSSLSLLHLALTTYNVGKKMLREGIKIPNKTVCSWLLCFVLKSPDTAKRNTGMRLKALFI